MIAYEYLIQSIVYKTNCSKMNQVEKQAAEQQTT